MGGTPLGGTPQKSGNAHFFCFCNHMGSIGYVEIGELQIYPYFYSSSSNQNLP
jgi:hypothetical protein